MMTPPLELGGVVNKFREGLTGQARPPGSYGRAFFLEQQIPYLTNSRWPKGQSFHVPLLKFWFLRYKHEIRESQTHVS